MLEPESARELARRAVDTSKRGGVDEAEALVMASSSALTRFADNRIHQNVSTYDASLSVRAVVGRRIGVASTNRLDDAGLAACCQAAADAARRSPEDPDFPGLPDAHPVKVVDRVCASTRAFDADARAEAVGQIVEKSASEGLTAAGKVSVSDELIAIANSRGVDVGMPLTACRATVLSMGSDSGSGWASFAGRDASALDAAAIGEEAASLALRSAGAGDLDPGVYTVVLAPEAVVEVVQYMSWFGLSAKAVEEGRSFMTGHIGERIMSPSVTIVDDALAPDALGLTFDFEGQPKQRTPMIERGVAVAPVTDSYWAAKTGRPNTGHALPAPNTFGPLPLDIRMDAGDRDASDLIASVERGVYVTRFHYVNVEDPIKATLTGMTRDGTFLIENGSLTRPLRNLRFTQSAVEALDGVAGISRERRMVGGEDGGSLVPYLLLERFAFTGQTG